MKHKLHLKAPGNWINDPNGFLYYKGMYHLFYQHFPYAPVWGTMHWGHAVSKDMINWEHKGIALFPSIRADQNGCFSGSAIEHDDKIHIFYTGVRYEVVDPDNVHLCLNEQFEASQLHIASENGYDFDNFHGKQVVIPPVLDAKCSDRTHTRDPKVWRGQNAWYMIIGGSAYKEQGKVLFYKSEDLYQWEYVNQATTDKPLGWMWECPDYYEVAQHQVLVISPIIKKEDGSGMECNSVCMLVDFQEDTCNMQIFDKYQLVDYGMDLYAPQTTLDECGRRVMAAWMRMPEAIEGVWNGMFCMPRVVEVKEEHIYFRLHPNLKHAFSRKIDSVLEAHAAGYCVKLDLQEGQQISIGGYKVERKNGAVYTDRSGVYPSEEKEKLRFSTPEIREGYHLDIYVEPNLIEIYINDGEYVLSSVVYGLSDKIEADIPLELYTIE